MKKNEDYFIYTEQKESIIICSKQDPEDTEFTVFIAIKFSNARIDKIADNLKVYGDLDCSNIRA
jgi:hypothetical protein